MIETLLTEYYDPQYQHHEQKNQSRIIHRGTMSEVRAWLRDRVN